MASGLFVFKCFERADFVSGAYDCSDCSAPRFSEPPACWHGYMSSAYGRHKAVFQDVMPTKRFPGRRRWRVRARRYHHIKTVAGLVPFERRASVCLRSEP